MTDNANLQERRLSRVKIGPPVQRRSVAKSQMDNQADNNHDYRPDFPSTTWTLIQKAQKAGTEERNELLNVLLRLYWKPLYACYRAAGQSPDDAEDLVQGFFCNFVTKGHLRKVNRRESRFRAWLCICASNYLKDQLRRRTARKRQPVEKLLSFEELRGSTGAAYEPQGTSIEANFTEAWRRDLLERAFRSVETESRDRGRCEDYQIFVEYYCAAAERKPTWKELAKRYGLADWKVAARKADWIKGKLATAIRSGVRVYVDSDAEVDDEIRELLE